MAMGLDTFWRGLLWVSCLPWWTVQADAPPVADDLSAEATL